VAAAKDELISRATAAEEALDYGEDAWKVGPPAATVLRRAQSYSDFYHAVHAYSRRGEYLRRKRSSNNIQSTPTKANPELSFENEFGEVEGALLHESHAKYQTYQGQLELSDAHLDHLLGSTKTTLELLSGLSASFKLVEAQTGAFRKQCEALVLEQRQLTALADAIDENAQYYTFLEPMTRRLNAPGAANLVRGKDFPELLSNLDNCLAYMESNPKHKESATYRSRYRLLLTRGLTLVRVYFTKMLNEIATDVSKRIQSGQLKENTQSALLYAKFRVPAADLKALGVEIQKRAVPTPDDVDAGREPEYLSLLRELYQSYSSVRGRLILPIVTKKISEIANSTAQADVLTFAKSSMSFMRGICLDEFELWFEWFETNGALYEFLESLMEPMYDYFRPRTIRETKMEKLCDLCSIIQSRYGDSDGDDEFENSTASPGPPNAPGNRKLDYASLVQPVLEDAQTRLVFLAMNVLRDGIENYRPTPEDLKIQQVETPATNGTKTGPVLSGKRDITPVAPTTPIPKTPVLVDVDSDDAESMFSRRLNVKDDDKTSSSRQWYPTLRKAIWLLRRIYRLVNSSVFDDLAHRIVHSTIQSLLPAAQQISSKHTPQDGQLFLITHLLHLKSQIVAFDIEFVPPEVDFDFSSLTNPFYELRDRGALWNPASWVRLVGGALLPKIVENMLDAKAELDGRLRAAINDFVHGYSDHITAPVDPAAIAAAKSAAAKAKTTAAKDAEAFDPLRAIRTVRGLAEKDVPALRAKLTAFVDDARTRETLVAAVRDQVLASYEDFFDSFSEGKGRRVSRKGKAREDEVLSPELFAETIERVFLVGRMVGDGDDEDDDDDDGRSGGGNVSD
jgi:hypothetical protein